MRPPAVWFPPNLRGSGPSGGIYPDPTLVPDHDVPMAGYPDRAGTERLTSSGGSPGTGAKRKPRPPE